MAVCACEQVCLFSCCAHASLSTFTWPLGLRLDEHGEHDNSQHFAVTSLKPQSLPETVWRTATCPERIHRVLPLCQVTIPDSPLLGWGTGRSWDGPLTRPLWAESVSAGKRPCKACSGFSGVCERQNTTRLAVRLRVHLNVSHPHVSLVLISEDNMPYLLLIPVLFIYRFSLQKYKCFALYK